MVLDTLPIVALTVIVLAVSLSATVKSPSLLIVVPDLLLPLIVHLISSLLLALVGVTVALICTESPFSTVFVPVALESLIAVAGFAVLVIVFVALSAPGSSITPGLRKLKVDALVVVSVFGGVVIVIVSLLLDFEESFNTPLVIVAVVSVA